MARNVNPLEESVSVKTLGEIRNSVNPEIEKIFNSEGIELEAFMHEEVDILINETTDDSQLKIQGIPVNGINMPVVRGVVSRVKRKYVESLARCTTSRFVQMSPDPNSIDRTQMIEKKIPVFPFTVIKDTDKGKAWLRSIYEQVKAA